MPGPPQKRSDQRRRRNKPANEPPAGVDQTGVAAPQPELGYDAHDLVVDFWTELGGSIEAKFYSAADWQRARLELHYLNQLLMSSKAPGAMAWNVVQAGWQAMLVSPAEKRRMAIEVQLRKVDVDEDAAVAQMDDYRSRFTS